MSNRFTPQRSALVAIATLAVGVGAYAVAQTSSKTAPVRQAAATRLLPPDRVIETHPMRSKQGLEYTIFVSKPTVAAPTSGFPVVYVADGNALFGITSEIARLNEHVGPVVVVGIGYPGAELINMPRRAFDFLPPTPLSEIAPYDFKTGGFDQFLRFIQDELKPRIEREVKIDRSRQTLMGHSLGGRLTLQVLFTEPAAFQNYVASSPSFGVDLKALLEAERRFEARTDKPKHLKVLLTAGVLEQFPDAEAKERMRRTMQEHPEGRAGKSVEEAMAEMAKITTKVRSVGNAKEFVERLTKSGVAAKFASFEGEEHWSVMPVVVNRAARLMLKGEF